MAEYSEDYEMPAARPTFITVLCILTFIGSGLGIISEVIKYASANSRHAAMSVIKDKNAVKPDSTRRNRNEFAIQMTKNFSLSPDNIRKTALADMAATVLCLAGALLMWNLKRTGFYLYVAGTLTGILSPFIILGGSNMLAIISSIGMGFIGVAFVIMYGVNLKYMR